MTLEGKIRKKLYCRYCNKKTNHGYLLKHREYSTGHEEWGVAFEDQYFITQCLGCDTIAFLREYGDEDMVLVDDYGQLETYTDLYVYPEEPVKTPDIREMLHPVREFRNAPELIEMLYSQVVSSYNSRHYLLCAVGLRMIIEGVCKELGVTEGFLFDKQGQMKLDKQGTVIIRNNLEGKINGLQANGIIVQNHAAILHQIRELGNVSAHELEVPKKSTIRVGIEIIENMLHNIFDLENFKIK